MKRTTLIALVAFAAIVAAMPATVAADAGPPGATAVALDVGIDLPAPALAADFQLSTPSCTRAVELALEPADVERTKVRDVDCDHYAQASHATESIRRPPPRSVHV